MSNALAPTFSREEEKFESIIVLVIAVLYETTAKLV
jgi:hypothetical protein